MLTMPSWLSRVRTLAWQTAEHVLLLVAKMYGTFTTGSKLKVCKKPFPETICVKENPVQPKLKLAWAVHFISLIPQKFPTLLVLSYQS
jgi:hypothetical protein